MGIVVLGSSNTDMILRVPRLPGAGETILGGEFTTAAGGKGANQAVAAARAGARVSLVARVGDDAFGRQTVAGFEREGIGVQAVLRDSQAPSGVAMIFVDEAGENSIGVASGANARLSPVDVDRFRDLIAGASILLVQLETPLETVEAAARVAHEAGATVILDPAPARALPEPLLSRVAILTPNRFEAEQLTGVEVRDAASASAAARQLRARGVGAVVVTLGSAGAVCVSDRGVEVVEGRSIDAVDSTGAGDVFDGCLAAALDHGRTLSDAMGFANGAAALSATRPGAQPSAPTREEIEAFCEVRS